MQALAVIATLVVACALPVVGPGVSLYLTLVYLAVVFVLAFVAPRRADQVAAAGMVLAFGFAIRAAGAEVPGPAVLPERDGIAIPLVSEVMRYADEVTAHARTVPPRRARDRDALAAITLGIVSLAGMAELLSERRRPAGPLPVDTGFP